MSYKNKFNKVLGFTLATFFISGGYVMAAEDTVVNDYDCSLPELREYVSKKTDYFVNSPTSITTWEEFKRQDILEGAGTGAVPKDGQNSEGPNSGKPEQCNYFWGDIDDWDTELEKAKESGYNKYEEYAKLLAGLMSGDLKGLMDAVRNKLIKETDRMLEEVRKGVCKRLSSQNVKKEIYRAADKYFSGTHNGAMGGFNPVDLVDGNYNGFVNNILYHAYGSNGKLLNVYDKNLDNRRIRYMERESDRQYDKMINR